MANIAFVAVLATLLGVAYFASLTQALGTLTSQGIRKAMEAGCYNRSRLHSKQGFIDEGTRWPNATVIYQWDFMQFTRDERKTIMEGFNWISNKTCIKFQHRLLERNYVLINRKESGCQADLGYKKNGRQSLNLERNDENGSGCIYPGPAAHEMIHVLGIEHEQNRPDRDDYIEVLLDNVNDEDKYNFFKNNNTNTYGLEYDFDSIMHYDRTTFSKNGNDTMVSKVPGKKVRDHINYEYLTAKDIALIKKMYNCP